MPINAPFNLLITISVKRCYTQTFCIAGYFLWYISKPSRKNYFKVASLLEQLQLPQEALFLFLHILRDTKHIPGLRGKRKNVSHGNYKRLMLVVIKSTVKLNSSNSLLKYSHIKLGEGQITIFVNYAYVPRTKFCRTQWDMIPHRRV